MRRIAFAGIAILILVVATAVLIPRGGRTPDAQAMLAGVAHAMEQARSIHLVYRPTPDAQRRWAELPAGRFTVEAWLGQRGRYMRFLAPDGSLARASGMSIDTLQWWGYWRESEEDPGTLYVADLTSVAERVRAAASEGARLLAAAEWVRLIGTQDLTNPEESVAVEDRNGRNVAILTFATASQRKVLEVDPQTNYLLGARYYFKEENKPEQLIATLGDLEYDRPPPADLTAMPKAARTARATVAIEDRATVAGLILKADGRTIDQMNVPQEPGRAKRPQRRPRGPSEAERALMRAARTPDTAKSFHAVYQSTAAFHKLSAQLSGPSGTMEFWMSPRALYARYLEPDGRLARLSAINADTGHWWVYDGEALYVADLARIGAEAAEVIARNRWLFDMEHLAAAHATRDLKNQQTTLATTMRDGRKVTVVTVRGTLPHGKGRNVFEIEPESGRFLTSRRYYQPEGGQEELIGALDPIEYDVPLPINLRTIEPPAGTPTVEAEAVLEVVHGRRRLVMKVGHKEIERHIAM